MKVLTALIACLVSANTAVAGTAAAAQRAEEPAPAQAEEHSPRPLLTLMEHNPWLMVIGSDSPTFALYDDGTVIFLKRVGETNTTIQTAKLKPDELKALSESLPLEELSELAEDTYVASSATDQTTTVVHAWRDGKRKSVSVYGNVRSGIERSKRQAEKKESPEDHMVLLNMKAIPQPFLKTVDRLIQFDHPGAERWVPSEVEVMIWPYAYAPDESLPWPKEWPGLKDSRTRRRTNDAYSLYLPSSKLEAFRKFLSSRREKQAILIDGKKWAVSYRMPFPRESDWMSDGR